MNIRIRVDIGTYTYCAETIIDIRRLIYFKNERELAKVYLDLTSQVNKEVLNKIKEIEDEILKNYVYFKE